MSGAAGTIRVIVPLHIRNRNGRPKILPPDDGQRVESRGQQPHVLRAVARAWNWRQQLESGTATTIQDIAAAEKVSDRFISRMLRLAYLSPEVLEQLLIRRVPPAVTLNDMAAVAERPWVEHLEVVFGLAGRDRRDPTVVTAAGMSPSIRFGAASSIVRRHHSGA
jgi:hypothetical protein